MHYRCLRSSPVSGKIRAPAQAIVEIPLFLLLGLFGCLGVFWCLGWCILRGGLVTQVPYVVLADLMGRSGLVWSGSVHGETNNS